MSRESLRVRMCVCWLSVLCALWENRIERKKRKKVEEGERRGNQEMMIRDGDETEEGGGVRIRLCMSFLIPICFVFSYFQPHFTHFLLSFSLSSTQFIPFLLMSNLFFFSWSFFHSPHLFYNHHKYNKQHHLHVSSSLFFHLHLNLHLYFHPHLYPLTPAFPIPSSSFFYNRQPKIIIIIIIF